MDAEKTARAWVDLDMAALRSNTAYLRSLLPAGCKLMPAVKANAYGHGAVPIARELNGMGISAFCTATADEGAQLRRAGIKGDILVLGYTHPNNLKTVLEYDLTQAIVDIEYAKALISSGLKLRTQLAVDTGMHRLGIDHSDTEAALRLCACGSLGIEGAFTHICTDSNEFSALQAQRFSLFAATLRKHGAALPRLHLMSSQSLLNQPWLGGDYARIGIALYGVMSRREDATAHAKMLSPVLSLKARVASVRNVDRGEGVGYGLCFRPQRNSRIAALSIGYADGLPSSASGAGVLINGEYAPIVGKICMDQTLVDATDISVSPGDTAVLIGKSGDKRISAYELAEACGVITNELLSRLGARLERIVM